MLPDQPVLWDQWVGIPVGKIKYTWRGERLLLYKSVYIVHVVPIIATECAGIKGLVDLHVSEKWFSQAAISIIFAIIAGLGFGIQEDGFDDGFHITSYTLTIVDKNIGHPLYISWTGIGCYQSLDQKFRYKGRCIGMIKQIGNRVLYIGYTIGWHTVGYYKAVEQVFYPVSCDPLNMIMGRV